MLSVFNKNIREVEGSKPLVLLCGASSVSWFISEYGCLLYGLPAIPCHASSSVSYLTAVITRAKPSVLLLSLTSFFQSIFFRLN